MLFDQVSSIIGGYLSQEVLKCLSHVGEPMFNIFEFTGQDNVARVIPSHVVAR